METTNQTGPAQRARPLRAADVFKLLGNRQRWEIVRLLADGLPRTATDLARVLGRDFDGVSKHLRLMREAGVLESRAGEDRRLLLFCLPERFRSAPGVLDFGVCTARLD